ncbi:MAG TPA: OadG family transporter subunit [Clostridia bacterium]
MDILNSLYISVFGMSVVFVVLVSLILLINLQSFVAGKISGRTAAAGNVSATKTIAVPAQAAKPAAATVYAGPQELKLTGVDDKTAAIIMAIVSDEIGVDPNQLYFKSIRGTGRGANL